MPKKIKDSEFIQHGRNWFKLQEKLDSEIQSENYDTILQYFKEGDIKAARYLLHQRMFWSKPLEILIEENSIFLEQNPVLKKNLEFNLNEESELEYASFNLLLELKELRDPLVEEIVINYISKLVLNKETDKILDLVKNSSFPDEYIKKINIHVIKTLCLTMDKEEIDFLNDILELLHKKEIFLLTDEIKESKKKKKFTQFVIKNNHIIAVCILNEVADYLIDYNLYERFGIRNLPKSICNLKNLQELIIQNIDSGCDDMSLNIPECFKHLPNLKRLSLEGIDFRGREEELFNYLTALNDLSLKDLTLKKSRFDFIPNSIGKLHKLEALSLSNTKINEFPQSFSNLKSLRVLNLYEAKYLGNLDELKVILEGCSELKEFYYYLNKHYSIKGHVYPMRKVRGELLEEQDSRVLIRLESGEDIWFEKPKVHSFNVYIPNLRQDFLVEQFYYYKQVHKDFYSKLRKLNKDELLTLVVISEHTRYLDQDKRYKKVLTRPKVYLNYEELCEHIGLNFSNKKLTCKDKPTIYKAIDVLLEQKIIKLTKKREYLLTDVTDDIPVGTLLKGILEKKYSIYS